MKSPTYAVLYTHPDGRTEVRYRQPRSDTTLARQVLALQRAARAGRSESPCPYSLSTHSDHIL